MSNIKISSSLLIGLLIAAFVGISLLYRIYLPYGEIFVGDNIKYGSGDAYFYMRLVDNASYNFPHMTQFDPYYLYPGGNNVAPLPLFNWLIVIFAWIAGLGHPTQHTIDMIAVYLPAILGALMVIPVFFIGKMLFNKWVGVLAAGLIAILPGEFMSRSILGSSDFPVVEVLFTTTALAFLILAIKTANQNQLTFDHIFKRDWKIILKPLIYSLLAGLFLGLYLASWQGALLFVFIIILYYLIQFIINHLNHKSSDYLCFIGFISFLVAFLIFIPFVITRDTMVAMALAVLVPLVLYGISKFISSRGLKPYFYPMTLVIIAALSVVVVYFTAHDIYTTLLSKFNFVFFPIGSTASTTIEMAPLLIPQNTIFLNNIAWGNFTSSFFIAPWWLIFGIGAAAICGYLFYINDNSKSSISLFAFFLITTAITIIFTVMQLPNQYVMAEDQIKFLPGTAFIALSIMFYSFVRGGKNQRWYISVLWVLAILITLSLLMVFTTFSNLRYVALVPLAILIYILFKHKEGDEYLRFFIIWNLVILLILMVQRRFGYYFAVNVALLSGYLAWQVIWLSGIKKLTKKPEEIKETVHISKTKMKRKAISERRSLRIYYVNVILAIIVVFFLVFCPNISKGIDIASSVAYAIPDDWQAAMLWLKDNTPEPLGDESTYYQLYPKLEPGESFTYPESVYAVTAWWDFGYWIMRIAHRIPNANPSQTPGAIKKIAAFFLSQDKATADELRKELGTQYVIADAEMAYYKFPAILNWAGLDQEKYLPTFYYPQENQLYPLQGFSIEYYKTLMVRLYSFNGEAVTGDKVLFLAYQEAMDINGIFYKQVTEAKEFVSYQDALNYAATLDPSTKYAILGIDPLKSPIALEALEDYEMVYKSATSDNATLPTLKIFEYVGDN